jgi:V/A-type H+-transporting ATPase subunit E
MTGLEKIIEDIRKESEESVGAVMKEAEEKTAGIRAEAKAEAEKTALSIRREASVRTEDMKKRTESAAELSRRKAILTAKQELISDAIAKALSKAEAMPDEQYFATVISMAARAAHPEEAGEICFCGKDLKRLPAGFSEKLNAALPEGSSLSVSKEAARISSGFLLKYGGVEENCSFDAVFAAKREELQDKVRGILFS